MSAPSRPGWRHLLRTHAPEFLAWLEAEKVFDNAFSVMASDLQSFLLGLLNNDPTIADDFMKAIPDVLGKCNDDIYDLPLRPEAYAYIHLLERYRRTWRVLVELTRTGDLPLARYGVRTLDVGTGPAPVLYAVNDFYNALTRFAETHQIEPLRLPMPDLYAVEGSHQMAQFFHQFSELAGRASGPFGAEWQDFRVFNPAGRRAAALKARVDDIVDEDDTSEAFARQWVHEYEGWRQGLHTYRLCVFSNFLTTAELLDQIEDRVGMAFGAVTPGGVVVVTGSDKTRYRDIYARVEEIAEAAGFRRSETEQTFDPVDGDPYAQTISRVYAAVWSRLVELGAANPDLIPNARYVWDPEAVYRSTRFALRAYRLGGTDG
jgi:ribosomal protein RSM22 (predicted rRNA methylase)